MVTSLITQGGRMRATRIRSEIGRARSLMGTLLPVLVGLAAACGDPSSPAADAALQADASLQADATSDAAPTGPVSVTVYETEGARVPVPGATVLFSDATHTVMATTSADGVASAEIAAGATVTVVRPGAPANDDDVFTIVTTLDVRPGDALVFGRTRADLDPDQPALDPTDVMWVEMPVLAGADRYWVSSSCSWGSGSSGSLVTVHVDPACAAGGLDLLLLAYTDDTSPDGPAVLGFMQVDDVAFTAETTVTAPDAWRSMETFDLSVRNVPAGVTASGDYFYWRGGQSFYSWPLSTELAVSGDTAFVLPAPPFVDEVTVRFSYGGPGRQRHRHHLPRGQDLAIDVGARLLPWITGVALDVAARRISWTASEGAATDGSLAILRYRTASGAPGYWLVVAPADARAVTLPDLSGLGARAPAELTPAAMAVVDYGLGQGGFRTGIEPLLVERFDGTESYAFLDDEDDEVTDGEPAPRARP
jgi:hypothetical protein